MEWGYSLDSRYNVGGGARSTQEGMDACLPGVSWGFYCHGGQGTANLLGRHASMPSQGSLGPPPQRGTQGISDLPGKVWIHAFPWVLWPPAMVAVPRNLRSLQQGMDPCFPWGSMPPCFDGGIREAEESGFTCLSMAFLAASPWQGSQGRHKLLQ